VLDHQGHRVPWLRFGVHRFRLTLAALLRAPSPAPFGNGFILPSFCSPAECFRCVSASPLQYGKAPSGGFRPSSRHQPGASTRLEIPRPRIRSVLGVSHALDGLLRSRPCGFISPRCRVQGSLFRGFPPGEAVPSRRRPVPSCRWRRTTTRQLPTERRSPSPRLQGFLPHRDPLQHRRGLAAGTTRSPPELSLLQVLCLLAVGALSRPLRS
jgi:hypothetical protein